MTKFLKISQLFQLCQLCVFFLSFNKIVLCKICNLKIDDIKFQITLSSINYSRPKITPYPTSNLNYSHNLVRTRGLEIKIPLKPVSARLPKLDPRLVLFESLLFENQSSYIAASNLACKQIDY